MSPARAIFRFLPHVAVVLGFVLLTSGNMPAQTPAPTPRPLLAPRATPSPFGQPPREVPLVEKKWDELSSKTVSKDGATALGIDREKWKHAETENFILHYRRATEAQKVAREVEYDLWFIASVLGATKERYARKSHVYLFEDTEEWQKFLGETDAPSWSASFAYGDELFLNVRRASDTGRFNSSTLAHEATHAVVARLFRGQRWPLWLSEGFAEYMGGASIAARKGQTLKRHQASLYAADLPLDKLEALTSYPPDELAVGQLYQSSEKFVRFLMTEFPSARITKFIEAVLGGKSMQAAVLAVYSDQVKDWNDFTRRYERFGK
ncbi:MAG TPA: hypothetical protein VF593_13230 [Chthoniobacteraceae bacterium]|jgi:hypothetical protein